MGEEEEDVEEDEAEEVAEETLAHMKVGLTYKMSPITLNIQSGTHSKQDKKKDNRGTGTH